MDLVTRKWIGELISAEETSTQVQAVFLDALGRRIREGKTKREALRSLKRHISRELYQRLNAIPLTS